MEIPILNAQHAAIILPVAVVVILAVLVFAFGFRGSVEPPSFKQLSYLSDDKKHKKKKMKDKRPQSNGHAVIIDVAESKKTEGVKTGKQSRPETPKQKKTPIESDVEKKAENQKNLAKKENKKVAKESATPKGKKNAQKRDNEKPADFDEGEWETAPSRKDKKKKKEELETVSAEKKSPVSKKNLEKKAEKIVELKPMEILRIEDILPPKKEDTPVVEETVPVVVAAPAPADDQTSKKKKAKKPKPPVDEATDEPKEVATLQTPSDSPQVFNELEDTWKEAPLKKSKKKARKD